MFVYLFVVTFSLFVVVLRWKCVQLGSGSGRKEIKEDTVSHELGLAVTLVEADGEVVATVV